MAFLAVWRDSSQINPARTAHKAPAQPGSTRPGMARGIPGQPYISKTRRPDPRAAGKVVVFVGHARKSRKQSGAVAAESLESRKRHGFDPRVAALNSRSRVVESLTGWIRSRVAQLCATPQKSFRLRSRYPFRSVSRCPQQNNRFRSE